MSEWVEVRSGVPQGSVLGPLLFLIFINDLDDEIVSKLCKFADDTKLGRGVRTEEEAEKLRQELKLLCRWAEDWQMLFNLDKCVVMHFGNSNKFFEYEINGRKLKTATVERDLGVLISSDGRQSEQCIKAANTANKVLGMIKRNIKSRRKDIIVRLYKTLVRPHLEYCVQAWCPYQKKDIEILERVQRRATRMIAECRGMGYTERLKVADLTTLECRRVRGDMIEVFKIMKGFDGIASNKFFELETNARTRGHSLKLKKKRSRLDVRKHYFSNRVVNNWNSLSEQVVAAGSVNSFKERLDKFIKESGGEWKG